jgi:hypothetical protein
LLVDPPLLVIPPRPPCPVLPPCALFPPEPTIPPGGFLVTSSLPQLAVSAPMEAASMDQVSNTRDFVMNLSCERKERRNSRRTRPHWQRSQSPCHSDDANDPSPSLLGSHGNRKSKLAAQLPVAQRRKR